VIPKAVLKSLAVILRFLSAMQVVLRDCRFALKQSARRDCPNILAAFASLTGQNSGFRGQFGFDNREGKPLVNARFCAYTLVSPSSSPACSSLAAVSPKSGSCSGIHVTPTLQARLTLFMFFMFSMFSVLFMF